MGQQILLRQERQTVAHILHVDFMIAAARERLRKFSTTLRIHIVRQRFDA